MTQTIVAPTSAGRSEGHSSGGIPSSGIPCDSDNAAVAFSSTSAAERADVPVVTVHADTMSAVRAEPIAAHAVFLMPTR